MCCVYLQVPAQGILIATEIHPFVMMVHVTIALSVTIVKMGSMGLVESAERGTQLMRGALVYLPKIQVQCLKQIYCQQSISIVLNVTHFRNTIVLF